MVIIALSVLGLWLIWSMISHDREMQSAFAASASASPRVTQEAPLTPTSSVNLKPNAPVVDQTERVERATASTLTSPTTIADAWTYDK
jgi:hypothetical protein